MAPRDGSGWSTFFDEYSTIHNVSLLPTNPARWHQVGDEIVTGDDYVFADEDGVTFVHQQYLKTILDTAAELSEKERKQADQIKQGKNLYQQFGFDKFLDLKKTDPGFRSGPI
ncbi:MAG TPA: hypothetical protein VFE53_12980 [Mucilaginibacter sp.]|jgi:hypothetical protein|nr:hypothetical protein [Mucilaginibacter sp.]